MGLLTPLYDQRNEKYPTYHLGILAFIITTGIPLNLGMTKLPLIDVVLLFVGGFFSLFMIARHDGVGQSLLSHLHVPSGQQNRPKIKHEPEIAKTDNLQYKKSDLDYGRIHTIYDPFSLLQNVVEQIVITHEDHMDVATRIKLHGIHRRLANATNKLAQS
jgi:hypothetical protein